MKLLFLLQRDPRLGTHDRLVKQMALCEGCYQASKVGVTDVVCHIDSKMHQNNAKSARFQTACSDIYQTIFIAEKVLQ